MLPIFSQIIYILMRKFTGRVQCTRISTMDVLYSELEWGGVRIGFAEVCYLVWEKSLDQNKGKPDTNQLSILSFIKYLEDFFRRFFIWEFGSDFQSTFKNDGDK